MTLHGVDVALVNETHLRQCDQPRIPNYVMYRNDRQGRPGGGTAIYVKTSLKHHAVHVEQLVNMEATAIEVEIANVGYIRLVSVYNPPDRALLDADLEAALAADRRVVVAGDLNAKHPSWHSRRTNPNGNRLHSFAEQRAITVDAPQEPTHYSPTGLADVLDVTILKDVPLQHHLQAVNELDSDHTPVLLFLGSTPRGQDSVEKKTTSWPDFTAHLQEHLPRITPIRSNQQLEEAVQTLTNAVKNSLLHATRTRREPRREFPLPAEIRDLIREKNRQRRRWQLTWDPEERRLYNQLAAEVKTAVRNHRNECWETKIREVEENECAFWRLTKILRNRAEPLPPIHGENGLTHTAEDKAEAFADCMELQCSPNFEDADLDHVERIEAEVRRLLRTRDRDVIRPTNPAEVKKLIQRTNPKKAPGPDGISNRALKEFPVRAVAALTNIINAVLRLRHFPSTWKIADVVMIKKPGQSGTFPQNYRPISLLPTMGKICEQTILDRLNFAVEEKNVLPNEQFGFRARHSTVHQVLRIVEFATEGFNVKESTGAVFLDVSKAFDKVWHEGLIHKLSHADIPTGLVRLTGSFLKDRRFRVKLGDTRSSVRTAESGVPQGSTLSPLLFSVFTKDIPRTEATELALYADDTAVYTRSVDPRLITRRLQRAADDLEDWFTTWRIGVNADKSSALFLTKRRKAPDRNITIFDREVPWRDQAKYLGITIDQKMTWKNHISTCTNKTKMALSRLYCLLCRSSKLSSENKIRIYKTIIRPMMTYGCAAWGYAAPTHINKLQVIQNKVLRMAIDAPWFVRNTQIHRDLDIPTIHEFIQDAAQKLYQNADDHENPLISSLGDYDEDEPHKHKRPRMLLN